jgi:hypothetical protein
LKKRASTKTDGRAVKTEKPPKEKPSAAAQQLGGQPENDADARAAGFESATSGSKRKPRPCGGDPAAGG